MIVSGTGEVPAAPIAIGARSTPIAWPPPGHAAVEPGGRAKLWRLDGHYFCSIIGTCLGTGELRKLVARATGERTDKLTDLEVHERAVRIAGDADGGGRSLHKALDQRHQLTIRRFDHAKTLDDLRALWADAQASGDIPGGYWAVLTHRTTTRELRARAFGDVHMLSHLVGAANRADIRRLAVLDAENAALTAKVERQETRLRETIGARDATIRGLREELTRRIACESTPAETLPQGDQRSELTLHELVRSLEQRLAHEAAGRERAEARLRANEAALDETRTALRAALAQQRETTAELQALEARLADDSDCGAQSDALVHAALAARVVLYVGGRPGPAQIIRDLVQRHGGTFLHHDGGIEDRMRLIVGDIHRADLVFFPTDCVSHDAVILVKRACSQAGKRYHALRTSGVASFLAALTRTVTAPVGAATRGTETA